MMGIMKVTSVLASGRYGQYFQYEPSFREGQGPQTVLQKPLTPINLWKPTLTCCVREWAHKH